ncbi:type I-E CRISPR-associated protein Cas5/CasD [Amorphus sp. 3PC139-8]|uniref:type I-E CRISPR-associated protein Cas5/CasD n=1 Tax=Amorphus sp. 3PC139-8 TaxID=2735676 RepID=UPI00345DEEB4
MEFLVFTLDGPMSAWGDISPGRQRTSWSRPSRSAVIGLIAAALGIRHGDNESLGRLHDGLSLAVETLRRGKSLVDYQIIEMPTEPGLRKYRKEHGSPPPTRGASLECPETHTLPSHREYRVDASYRAAICRRPWSKGPALEEIREALVRPKFQLYLGRKSCPLALPPKPECLFADDVTSAFDRYATLMGQLGDSLSSGVGRILREDTSDGEIWSDVELANKFERSAERRDVLLSSDVRRPRRFSVRREVLLTRDHSASILSAPAEEGPQ